MNVTPTSSSQGAVYDRGYRPYQGDEPGRVAADDRRTARWALYRLTLRRILGIRRSWRQKLVPWGLLALATLPAAVNVGIRVMLRDTPASDINIEFISYADYLNVSMLLLLFVAVAAPDAVCPDRRYRLLPLLFSRPLKGGDYAAAKVAAMVTVLFGFALGPQVVLFVGQMLLDDGGAVAYVGDHAAVLWQVPLGAAVLAAYLATLSIALSSLVERRMVAGVLILGTALVGSVVASLLVAVTQPLPASGSGASGSGATTSGSAAALLDVFQVPLYLRDVIFDGRVDPSGPLGGVAGGGVAALVTYVGVLGVCAAVLQSRYKRVSL